MHIQANSFFRISLFLILILASPYLVSQSAAANGSLGGTVVDPQGSVVAGAQITVVNNDLSFKRKTVTDANGNFTVAALPGGAYTVQANAPGFTLKKAPRINVSAGSSVRITLKLDIAQTSQEVTVTGRGTTVEGNTVVPAVNKDDPSTGNTIAGLTVTYLPNRDRDFSQFGQLAAGVTADPSSNGLSFAGQRASSSTEAVDGADFDDPLRGGPRGAGDGAFFFPQTVVREFQVVRSGTGAEVGGSNAGFINVVTKSGGNKPRGEAFYIGRPPLLTSHDAFGHPLDNMQNEFGASIGGPIRRNRAFFYLGVEQDFLQVPYWIQFQRQPPGIAVPAFLSGLQGEAIEETRPTALFARTDFLLNAANTLDFQVNFNHIHSTHIDSGSTRTIAAQDNSAALNGNSVWLRANLATVFNTDTVNQFLLQWTRDTRNRTAVDSSPEIVINDFGILGGNSSLPDRSTSESRRVSDDVFISRGARLLRAGVEFSDNPASEVHESNLNGRFDFNTLADFLNGAPRRYRQTFVTGDAQYRGSIRDLGFYLTGKLPLRKNLSLTAGLRWDGQWNPQAPGGTVAQTAVIPNDLSQWQPRIGLAWNPADNTVVRVSSGLYDAHTPATVFERVFTDNGVNTLAVDSFFDPALLPLVSAPGLALHALALPPPAVTTNALLVGIAPAFRNPHSFQAAAGIEQQLGRQATLSAGYIRNSTWDLQTRLDQNLGPPAMDASGTPVFPPLRPDPGIGRLLVNESAAHSSYDGLLATLTVQLPRRSQLVANYTLSRTRDDDSNSGPLSVDSVLNPFNLSADAAYSNLDVRHNFNLSGVVNLLWGLKVNPILVARSGLPYTPVIGFDRQDDANDLNDRAILNGRTLPRNIFRQPSFFNFDLRLVKDFALKGEGRHLDLFMDIFNLTGATNRNFGRQLSASSARQALQFSPPGSHCSPRTPTISEAPARCSSRPGWWPSERSKAAGKTSFLA